jgi:hypothetical protein
MLVAFTVVIVSATPPNVTVAPAWKLVPATVTAVPPALVPLFGVTELTVGGGAATYVKQLVHVPLCASALVTVTFTAPLACAAVVPVMLVALTVATASAAPPNETLAPAWNPPPAMVTAVPPAVEPLFGVTLVTVGGGAGVTYVKHDAHVAACVSAFVTVTFTEPAAWAVVVPVMLVPVTPVTVRADPPNDTVAPAWNPVPVTLTDVPPDVDPLFGLTDVTVGAGAGPAVRKATCWIAQKAVPLRVTVAAGRLPLPIVRLSAS